MFGCAAVFTVPYNDVPTTLPDASTLPPVVLIVPADDVMLPAVVRLPTDVTPVTDKDVKVPSEVIVGCDACDTVVAEPVTLPVTGPLKCAADTLPVTARDVNVPTEVTFG